MATLRLPPAGISADPRGACSGRPGPHDAPVEPERRDDDEAPERALQRRDKGFVLRLVLRLTVVALFVTWLLMSDLGANIGAWAADGFGSLTGG